MLVALVVAGIFVAQAVSHDASGDDQSRTVVTRVVDGDTVEIASGEHVRLIGIDTPEVGACGYGAATAKLRRMVEGRKVILVNPDSVQDIDAYGRLLRYVDVGGEDVGLAQIRAGARARYDSRDGYDPHPREGQYHRSEMGNRSLPALCPVAAHPPDCPHDRVHRVGCAGRLLTGPRSPDRTGPSVARSCCGRGARLRCRCVDQRGEL